jgi:hypothetical protein
LATILAQIRVPERWGPETRIFLLAKDSNNPATYYLRRRKMMPGSNACGLEEALAFIIQRNPRSVLDVGMGFGKWGMLTRLYLDVYHRRWKREDWQVQIDAIEIYYPYLQHHQLHLYNQIIIGQAQTELPKLGDYDLIIAADVIEHMCRGDGERLIETMKRKAQALLITLPIGPGWLRPGQKDNPYEAHVSRWDLTDLPEMQQSTYEAPCGLPYAVCTWTKEYQHT